MDGLVVVLVAVVVLLVMAALGARIAVRRANRIVPGVASPVPVRWLVTSRREAVYHRRLRALGRRLDALPATDATAEIRDGIRRELLELDAFLPVVARRPGSARRADRRLVSGRIAEIDLLVRRLEDRARSEPVSLDALRERMDLLEAADDELRELGNG